MRRLYRRNLPINTRLDLRRRERLCVDALAARAEWTSYRPSAPARIPVDALRQMAGTRNRCFYCSDGRGADVDHYVPISRDPSMTFVWKNLLWVCPECNRSKSSRSPVVEGVWVLDPTVDDPWGHLILDTATGVVAPRYLDGELDVRAVITLQLFKALTWEEVIEGRGRAIRRLRDGAHAIAEQGDTPRSRAELLRAVAEDDYGVARWFALWDGRVEDPFHAIRTGSPSLWRRFVAAAAR